MIQGIYRGEMSRGLYESNKDPREALREARAVGERPILPSTEGKCFSTLGACVLPSTLVLYEGVPVLLSRREATAQKNVGTKKG